MIETLMALWNRGVSGRLLVIIVTFFCLCISISLLFVTVGSVWGSLLTHGRPGGKATAVNNTVLITATAPPSGATATAPVEITPTLPPNLCLASPTGARGNTARVDATKNHGRSGVPTRTATSGPLHRTPTPGATMLPTPSPTVSPTLPAVTPTVPLTPTVTAQPTATPIATNTPGNTPTVVVTPTGTSTPGATPTPTPTVPGGTPTVGLAPTSTDTPTATGTATPVTTPTVTVTAPAGSPTVIVSATGGINSRQVHDGRPQVPGTPVDANNGQPGQGNCLGDTLMTSGEASLLSRLQDFFWIILVSSLLGTTLFCAQMYRLSRKAHR
ncbi:MAG TPA: hypothetical protein VIZ18_09635 [Ktedonobacteraceae bacterium]